MTNASARADLLPEPTDLTRPFWDGLAEGKLRLQHCRECDNYQYPAEAFCYFCGATDIEWKDASGKGEVHTFITVHQRYHPAFADLIPYNVSVVELEEGPRLVSNVIGIDVGDVRIGLPVRVAPQKESNGQFALAFERNG